MSNTLEKLSHQFHMQEIYSKAAVLYKEMLEDSTLDTEFCSCANDILNNGVLAEMAGVAKILKYRARTGRARGCNDGYDGYNNGYNNGYNAGNNLQGGCTVSATATLHLKPLSKTAVASRSTTKQFVRTKRSAGDAQAEDDLHKLEQEYLNNTNQDTAWALLNAGGWRPNTVTGPKEWVTYSAMLYTSIPTDTEIKDFATFLYCKLNQPTAQPTDLF